MGYVIGTIVVLVVAGVAIALIVTARRIGDVAEDATRSLALARDRTEALWQISATNQVAAGLLEGARTAREALSGASTNGSEALKPTPSGKGLGGAASGLAGESPAGDAGRQEV